MVTTCTVIVILYCTLTNQELCNVGATLKYDTITDQLCCTVSHSNSIILSDAQDSLETIITITVLLPLSEDGQDDVDCQGPKNDNGSHFQE